MNEKYFTLFLDKECPVNKYGIVLNHIFPFEEMEEINENYYNVCEINYVHTYPLFKFVFLKINYFIVDLSINIFYKFYKKY